MHFSGVKLEKEVTLKTECYSLMLCNFSNSTGCIDE